MQIAVLEILFDLQNLKKYTIDCLANKDMFLLVLPVDDESKIFCRKMNYLKKITIYKHACMYEYTLQIF